MRTRRLQSGFTLVELLVAIFAMAVLAVMSWRGLDSMTRAQAQTEARSDEVLTLQVGLAQWGADLDAMAVLPATTSIDWNGRVVRMVRYSSAGPAAGIVVAAWSRRVVDGTSTWLRWQSPEATTREQLDQAWLQADVWAQNAGEEERRREVPVVPLQEWQVFFFRGNAWTNPMSSAVTTIVAPPLPSASAAGGAGARGTAQVASTTVAPMPDGVRLVLVLPPGQAISGTLSRDWVRPTLGGAR
jgi:general secretion pathway protein J